MRIENEGGNMHVLTLPEESVVKNVLLLAHNYVKLKERELEDMEERIPNEQREQATLTINMARENINAATEIFKRLELI